MLLRTPPTRIQKWIQSTQKNSGFVFASPTVQRSEHKGKDENLILEEKGDHLKMEWEFRISVLPTQENLNKVVTALSKVFAHPSNDDIAFKCLVLNEEKQNDASSLGWDGTQTQLNAPSDRDQRGKEICIYMRYDPEKKQYQRTPLQWKQLMLTCWKTLLTHDVQGLGYAYTPAGDKAVNTELGISSPFTYTSFKPYKGRHALLFASDYNPNHHADPLQGVVITHADLETYQIPKESVSQLMSDRIAYLTKHTQQAHDALAQEIKTLDDKTPVEVKETDTLKNKIAELQQLLKSELKDGELDAKCAEISQLIPRQPNSTLESNDLIKELEFIRTQINKKRQPADSLLPVLEKIIKQEEQIAQDVKAVFQDFTENAAVMSRLAEFKIDEKSLKRLVETHPVKMQLMFRKLVHLHHEEVALKEITTSLPENLITLLNIIRDDSLWKPLPYSIRMMRESIAKCGQDVAGLIAALKKIPAEESGALNFISKMFASKNPNESIVLTIFKEIQTWEDLEKCGSFRDIKTMWLKLASGVALR
jgi:hypothetical protein